jgi:hypothetical protein
MSDGRDKQNGGAASGGLIVTLVPGRVVFSGQVMLQKTGAAGMAFGGPQ